MVIHILNKEAGNSDLSSCGFLWWGLRW